MTGTQANNKQRQSVLSQIIDGNYSEDSDEMDEKIEKAVNKLSMIEEGNETSTS